MASWYSGVGHPTVPDPQVARVASSVTSGTPLSAFETGQLTFAPSAYSTKPSWSTPGTVPTTTIAPFVIPSPGWNVTVTEASGRAAGVPAPASACESAIEKHDAHAAAISSSGLVRPSGESAREAPVTSRGATRPPATTPV